MEAGALNQQTYIGIHNANFRISQALAKIHSLARREVFKDIFAIAGESAELYRGIAKEAAEEADRLDSLKENVN